MKFALHGQQTSLFMTWPRNDALAFGADVSVSVNVIVSAVAHAVSAVAHTLPPTSNESQQFYCQSIADLF